MYTYQDYLEYKKSGKVESFVESAITQHKGTHAFEIARDAEEYYKRRNVTISQYQKFLHKITGEKIADNFSPNYKTKNGFFPYFITQETQALLGNGVTFGESSTKDNMGKKFDIQVQKAGKFALIEGISFGFWNFDHLEVFKFTEFVPLWDEEDGALKAGIRFWQLDDTKPLRATLYDLDGYTEYIRKKSETIKEMRPKRPYIIKAKYTDAFGTEIYAYENYPTFPIVPCYGSSAHQSELVGRREKIDCYDLIESGFANNIDTASQIYWLFKNAGGMSDVDIVTVLERIKTMNAAAIDDSAGNGATVEPHTVEVPTEARETLLKRLRDGLFDDFMALDVKNIASGATTATQIQAAYEPLNQKLDDFEYCMNEFISGILELNGIDDEPTFQRSMIVNQAEQTTMVLAAAQYLDDETILKHLPFLSVDEVDGILDAKTREEASRYKQMEKELEEFKAEEVDNGGQGASVDGREDSGTGEQD